MDGVDSCAQTSTCHTFVSCSPFSQQRRLMPALSRPGDSIPVLHTSRRFDCLFTLTDSASATPDDSLLSLCAVRRTPHASATPNSPVTLLHRYLYSYHLKHPKHQDFQSSYYCYSFIYIFWWSMVSKGRLGTTGLRKDTAGALITDGMDGAFDDALYSRQETGVPGRSQPGFGENQLAQSTRDLCQRPEVIEETACLFQN